jgi:predicted nucleotidyltransferase
MDLSIADKLLLQQYFTGIPVKKAYLFGSRARNEANLQSDIDILVELDHSRPIGMKFFTYQTDLEELLHKKVDLITTEGLSSHVKPFIDKDKILIYERVDH